MLLIIKELRMTNSDVQFGTAFALSRVRLNKRNDLEGPDMRYVKQFLTLAGLAAICMFAVPSAHAQRVAVGVGVGVEVGGGGTE